MNNESCINLIVKSQASCVDAVFMMTNYLNVAAAYMNILAHLLKFVPIAETLI